MASERRWIILGDDGRHVIVGRHSDPSDDEIAKAGEALRAAGHGGWLAVTEGDYYARSRRVSVMMVRELSPAKQPWERAVAAFEEARARTLAAALS